MRAGSILAGRVAGHTTRLPAGPTQKSRNEPGVTVTAPPGQGCRTRRSKVRAADRVAPAPTGGLASPRWSRQTLSFTTLQHEVGKGSVLFRRHGYSATGLKRIAVEADAPFGSIYHFFPGDRKQLAEEMIRTSGTEYGRMVLALLDSVPDPAESLLHAFEAAADDLAAADDADARPIGTVALKVASSNEMLRVATAEGPATRPPRPRAGRQGLRLPSEPGLPAPPQDPLHHPGQGRPGAQPPKARIPRRPTASLRPD
uniref:TetR/AcrR family transcriptional regulator n=1 Tax=Streptomyces sp. WI03-5b TaxID=462946 RepID=UPI0039F4E877